MFIYISNHTKSYFVIGQRKGVVLSPVKHKAVSAGLAVPCYYFAGSVIQTMVVMAAQVGMDVDHIIDYLFFGK